MPETGMDDSRSRQPPFTREQRAALRRQAVQLAAQLPEDRRQALYVLTELKTLLLDFLDRDDEVAAPPLRLVGAIED